MVGTEATLKWFCLKTAKAEGSAVHRPSGHRSWFSASTWDTSSAISGCSNAFKYQFLTLSSWKACSVLPLSLTTIFLRMSLSLVSYFAPGHLLRSWQWSRVTKLSVGSWGIRRKKARKRPHQFVEMSRALEPHAGFLKDSIFCFPVYETGSILPLLEKCC